MSDGDLLTALPHRAPFRFLTTLTSIEPGRRAEGSWTVAGDEDFLRGHFPGRPLVPGALIAESMAQLAGLLLFSAREHGPAHAATVAHFDVRFRRPVTPPATLVLRARPDRSIGSLHQFEVQARIGHDTIAEGRVVLAEAPS